MLVDLMLGEEIVRTRHVHHKLWFLMEFINVGNFVSGLSSGTGATPCQEALCFLNASSSSYGGCSLTSAYDPSLAPPQVACSLVAVRVPGPRVAQARRSKT
jgi:hypothetical protein